MLPDTSQRFGLVQIFDWDGNKSHPPLSPSVIAQEAPHYDTVWGSFNPSAWDSAHPGMYVSHYMLPVEDDNSVSGHNLTWWQQNHPDWILYACDTNGNPTKLMAWSTDAFPNVPLDFTNPDVIKYQMDTEIPYLQANGYNAIAADNTDLFNYLRGGNPNFGEPYYKGYYGCGTYDTSGNFHRIFAPNNDPNFASAMINWVKNVQARLHAVGMKIIINHPLYNPVTNPNEEAILSYSDAMVYEVGFTNYGNYMTSTASLLTQALTWARYAQTHNVAFLITDYLCTHYGGTETFNNNAPCPTDPLQIPAPQVDWALSTYMLANYGGADVYISPQVGNSPSYRPEYSTTYGAPCGDYTVSNNLYVRKFQGALVVVNASTSPVNYALPTTHQYRDIENRAVGNPLSLGAADGYVLLTTNGCS